MPKESSVARARRARQIAARLATRYPRVEIPLRHRNRLELLIATILSAQSTDAMVNRVTPALFARWRTAADYAGAPPSELETMIHSTGFFHAKARAIRGMARALLERHGGEVPESRDALEALPGVGRKTANVILNTAFGHPTIAVDTHIFRVANRTGLAPGEDVREVEDKLLKAVPGKFLKDAHHWLILHGRYVCRARKPDCPACIIRDLCAYKGKTKA